jgi:hypothetical protein
MAYALQVDKLDDDGTIRVRHVFFGETKDDCRALRDQHAHGCQAFGPALRNDDVLETWDNDSEIPEWEAGDDGDEEGDEGDGGEGDES